MKKYTLLLLTFFTIGFINAQSIEEELGFMYVKADYLLETDRYEDAIYEFSKIIEKDNAYKDVLYKRATAKFAIGAFKGTKNDLLMAFEVVGVLPEAVILYGKALRNLNEDVAASNTEKTASMLGGEQKSTTSSSTSTQTTPTTTEKTPAEVIKEEADKIDEKVGTILDQILGTDSGTETEAEDQGGTTTGNDETSTSTGSDTDIIKQPKEVEVTVYTPDVSENEIFIDEDLTIIIKDGLGGRKVLNQPNILILNESSGSISVDVCVNQNGKVTDAVYNQNASSLNTQSLVSLAVRKSKEFWFEKSTEDEICGTFIFEISGRN